MNYKLELTQPKKLIEEISKIKKSLENISDDIFFKIEVILDELGSNSIKYSNKSKAYIKEFEDHFHIEFSNEGEKIPSFYINTDNTNILVENCLKEGHGLGLHIVRHLADEFDYNYENGNNKIIVKIKKDAD